MAMGVPPKGSSAKVVHAWLCHGADIHGEGGEPCHADDLWAPPQEHIADKERLDALVEYLAPDDED